jgi:glutathione synthase/RimK-type ligase-like ATP-grasp enzyme
MPKPVLIIAPQNDVHALTVQRVLELNFAAEAIIWDISLLFEKELLSFYPRHPNEIFHLNLTNHSIKEKDIHSVWWRRVEGFNKLPTSWGDKVARFSKNEYLSLIYGSITSLNIPVINNPYAETFANRKPYQLSIANSLGLTIPETLISNDPDAIKEFWIKNNRNCIYKTLTPMPDKMLETRRLLETDFAELDKVRYAPVIVQQTIEGLDIRINVIGSQVFGASAKTNIKEAEFDWRIDPTLKWEKHDIDERLQDTLRLLIKKLGLHYGSIDMRLTPNGDYFFFEINPSGQFLFIEIDTGQTLSDSMAQLLLWPHPDIITTRNV